jgi:hypothetical protein
MARNLALLRLSVCAGVLAAAATGGVPTPAFAQFGWIFGNDEPAPRPPGRVPGGAQQQQRQEEAAPPIELSPLEQRPVEALPPVQRSNRPSAAQGGVESQPLDAPQGVAVAPRDANTNEPPPARPLSGLPAGQRQPRTAPGQEQPPSNLGPTEPSAAQPRQATEQAFVQPPMPHVDNPGAVFAGLDKITGRITSFDVALGETVQYGALQVTARACYTRPPTETPSTDAFIEVDEVTLKGDVRRIYTGWMYAASPGLHAVEHPIYDIWLTDCKKPPQAVADTSAEKPAAPAPRRTTPAPRTQQRVTAPAPAPFTPGMQPRR